MTRTLPSVRLALATIVVSLSAFVFLGTSGGPNTGSAAAAGGTALPAGWELCILQGLGAPATPANVSDLDEWQVAEGGSTNNDAAYNPFNTRRTTDVNNAPLPETMTGNGFPAFANWLAGCASTVATLVQPNMWSITAALRSGSVSPPGAFLAAVDQSQWCAPSADGTPCYETAILGAAGSVATAVLTGSTALEVYGNVKDDVGAYQLSALAVSGAQGALGSANQNLAAALAASQAAELAQAAAKAALQRFAIDEYVSSGLYVSTSLPTAATHAAASPFGPQNADGVVAHQYESIAAGDLVDHDHVAIDAFKAARHHVAETSKAVADAMATLNADSSAQTHALAKLVADVSTLQTAGACTAITLTSAPLPPVPGAIPAAGAGSNDGTTTTTSTTRPSAPTTTTTTTSATTTTTLLGATSPAIVPTPIVPDTTTTSTLPPTTTTTVAPTTTTTNPAPSSNAPAQNSGSPAVAAPATADPGAFNALQGCVQALAPPAT